MPVYKTPGGEFLSGIKQYKKIKEKALIANTMCVDNITFKEVAFIKSSFFKKNNEHLGYAYIILENPQNAEISFEKLCEHAYYNTAFFGNLDEGGILDAFRNSKMDKYEKDEVSTIYMGIDYLTDSGYEEVALVKNVVEELKDMRDLNISMFYDIDEIKNPVLLDKEVFTAELKNEMYENYISALKLHYQKVKIIESYYDNLVKIKEIVDEKMSMFESKFIPNRDFGIIAPLRKLKYEVSYYIRVAETFEKVLNMNQEEYLNYISELDAKRIEERIKLIRNCRTN